MIWRKIISWIWFISLYLIYMLILKARHLMKDNSENQYCLNFRGSFLQFLLHVQCLFMLICFYDVKRERKLNDISLHVWLVLWGSFTWILFCNLWNIIAEEGLYLNLFDPGNHHFVCHHQKWGRLKIYIDQSLVLMINKSK